MTDGSDIDLSEARVFAERDRQNSARWYLLPDGRTLHSRAPGHMEPSIHTARDLVGSDVLIEITGDAP